MTRNRARRVWIGLAIAASAIALAVEPAAAASGVCKTTKTHFKVTKEGATTTSTTYSELPRSRIRFTQGGKNKGCVIVRLSALPRADYIMEVRAVLDETKLGKPDSVELEYDSPGYLSPRGFEFVFTNVAPGKHQAWIEWRTLTSSSNISQMYRRTVTLQHR